MSDLKLEVGKIYSAKNGCKLKVVSEDAEDDYLFPFQALTLKDDERFSYTAKGTFWITAENEWDLVGEVEQKSEVNLNSLEVQVVQGNKMQEEA
jgi:hypothetical protein